MGVYQKNKSKSGPWLKTGWEQLVYGIENDIEFTLFTVKLISSALLLLSTSNCSCTTWPLSGVSICIVLIQIPMSTYISSWRIVLLLLYCYWMSRFHWNPVIFSDRKWCFFNEKYYQEHLNLNFHFLSNRRAQKRTLY